MSRLNPDNFITIQGWMITDLNLKGNDLLVYAIIYGFSQDGESKFSGSRQYLADWCNCSVRSIQNILNDLVKKEYIAKYEEFKNNVKYCSYATNFTGSENFSRGGENTALNNIVDNKNNKLSKDNLYEAEIPFNFGKIIDTPKKKNLYQQCLALSNNYTDDINLQKYLAQYLDFILEKYHNEGKTLYANQWKGLLKNLDSINNKIESVKQSINKGYIGFYPVNTYSNFTNPDTNKSVQKKADINNLMKNKDGTLKTY